MEVEVSKAVMEGLEAVLQSGKTNMFDKPVVQKLLYEMNYFEAVIWIEDNRKPYAEGILCGFKVVS